MDLKKTLDENGYTETVKGLAVAKGLRTMLVARLLMVSGAEAEQVRSDIDGFDREIPKVEKALATELAATIKYVDANNYLELTMLQIEETMELVAEEFDRMGDSKSADYIRSLRENT